MLVCRCVFILDLCAACCGGVGIQVCLFFALEQQVEDALVCRCVLILDFRSAGGGCIGIQVCSPS